MTETAPGDVSPEDAVSSEGAVAGRGASTTAVSSKTERAYRVIKDRIADGTYSAGYRLVFDQLARELEVSPVPVREAVRRLEAEGYVDFQRNVGAQVSRIDGSQYADTMQALALLEGAVTALAAPLMSPADLARARDINARMRACLEAFDPISFTRLNHEFHVVLCQPCPNAHLRALVEREWARMNVIRRTAFGLVPGRAADSVEEHERLLGLISVGASVAEIERVARAHKIATLDAVRGRPTGAGTR